MRRTFTAKEKASVFELWKNGTGFSEIANVLGSKPRTIFTMLRDTGGIKPNEHMSEREEIRAGLSAKMSIRAIATALNCSPLTISREAQHNRGRRYYKAVDADNRANRMARRPKPCLLDQNLPVREDDTVKVNNGTDCFQWSVLPFGNLFHNCVGDLRYQRR